jgi:hypothetical protein
MNGWQEPVALLVVALTTALLVRGAWQKRRRPPGCGTDCACGSQASTASAPPRTGETLQKGAQAPGKP